MLVSRPPPGVRGTIHRRGLSPGRAALAVSAGATMTLAFAPYSLVAAAPVSIAAMIMAVSGLRPRTAVLLGWGYGFSFLGTHMAWLAASMGVTAWIAVVVLQACWFAMWSALCVLARPGVASPLWMATTWTLVELLRSAWPFGGLPWGRAGFVVVDSWWQGWLAYVGVTGATFLIVLSGAGLAAALGRVRRRPALTVGLVLGAATLSVTPLVSPYAPKERGSFLVALVQGAVPGDGTQVAAHHREVTRSHARATVELARSIAERGDQAPDLVVWPENSTATDPLTQPEVSAVVQTAAASLGAPLLVGAITDGPRVGTAANQGIVWRAGGPTADRYTKRHPVPFGEYIPLRSLLGGISPRLAEIPRDMLPGGRSTPLQIGKVLVADAICFDVAFDDVIPTQVANGAQVVVVQTSNASFLGTSQLEQQLDITRARALESGRWVAVASLNGISAVIRPDGSLAARAAIREPAVLVERLGLVSELSPAIKFQSHWPGALVVAAAAMASLRLLRHARAGRPSRWNVRGGGGTRRHPHHTSHLTTKSSSR